MEIEVNARNKVTEEFYKISVMVDAINFYTPVGYNDTSAKSEISCGGSSILQVKETYEEIKALIFNARRGARHDFFTSMGFNLGSILDRLKK